MAKSLVQIIISVDNSQLRLSWQRYYFRQAVDLIVENGGDYGTN
jgi:hypothetical protein